MIVVKKETTKSIEMEKRRKRESEAITSRSIDPIRGRGHFSKQTEGQPGLESGLLLTCLQSSVSAETATWFVSIVSIRDSS